MSSSSATPWGPRKPGEPTPQYLGRALEWTGLKTGDMARRAREGHFDDYQAPVEVASGFELITLVAELQTRRKGFAASTDTYGRISKVIDAVKAGEFDGTKEEANRWIQSREGQEALRYHFSV